VSTAYILGRTKVRPRIEALLAGFKRLGYATSEQVPGAITASDVLVIWNRYGAGERIAARFDEIGAAVLVMENGYLPHPSGADTLALARDQHLGAGASPAGDRARFAGWGVELAPWQDRGAAAPVLIAPQRGFGPSGVAMPHGWAEGIAAHIRRLTERPVRIRPHPGPHQPARALADDLAQAFCVVVWASRVGIEALVAGVPVISPFRKWIAAPATGGLIEDIRCPARPDRLPAFERLAWAQYTVEEIADGWPLAGLLRLKL
jgi:hypothetical protein